MHKEVSIQSGEDIVEASLVEELPKSFQGGILSTVGSTPLVKLDSMFSGSPFKLYAKLEMFNPGGSSKDRSAFNMLKQAILRGEIGPETTVIESSSGNLGIGLAQACKFLKLKFVCVVDTRTTAQHISLLKAYGAEVDLISAPDTAAGDLLSARKNRVLNLLKKIPESYTCDQYRNLDNSAAQYQTMSEIVCALGGRAPEYMFCAVSSCGTLRGCRDYIRDQGLDTKIVAIDAVGSVIFGGKVGPRMIPGHGAASVPPLMLPGLANAHEYVTDLDCVVGCHRLLDREAILAGGSSGGVMMAVQRYIDKLPDGTTCVAIVHDRGERYLDTIYNLEWVEAHFGDVSYLWK